MNNKRGVSEVITTVVIILISIIAIAVLGSFLLPLIAKSGSKVQQAEACLTVSIEVPSCVVAATSANVTVRRNAGTANMEEIRLIFEQETGATKVVSESIVPSELETRIYSEELGFSAKRVSAAAGIADSQGNINYCNPTQPVACRE